MEVLSSFSKLIWGEVFILPPELSMEEQLINNDFKILRKWLSVATKDTELYNRVLNMIKYFEKEGN